MLETIKKNIINYKLTLSELILNKDVIKKIKGELFDIKWLLIFYKIKWCRKFKVKINKLKKKEKKLALVDNRKVDKGYYTLKYGEFNIQRIRADYEFYKFIMQPLLEEDALWEGPTDISKTGRLQYVASEFFNKYNEFLIDIYEDNKYLIGRDPMFPLDPVKDIIFYAEILFLEKKYTNFFFALDKKDQNKLDGIIKLEAGDFVRYQNELSSFLENNKETQIATNNKK